LGKELQNIVEFESLFKEYFNPLVNFVNSRLNNWENSKEVVQMTFYKLWNNRNKIEVHTDIKSYLFQATRNSMIDFIRREKKFVEVEVLETVPDEEVRNEMDPYLIRNAIFKAMEVLKPKTKKIFELSKFEGLTYNEIANTMDISKRSVEDHMAKAMIQLRKELEKNDIIFSLNIVVMLFSIVYVLYLFLEKIL